MTTKKSSPAISLIGSLKQLFKLLPVRQRGLIGRLLALQIIAACSEVLSIGALMPFLGALTNAPHVMSHPALQTWLLFLDIHTQRELVIAMAGLFIGAILISNALRLLAIRMQYYYSAEIGNVISSEVYRRSLYQPYSFHTQHSSSEIIALSTSDALSVCNSLIPGVFYLVTNSLIVIAITFTLVAIDPWVALGAAFLVGGAYSLIIVKTREALYRNGRKISELNAHSVKVIQEGLGGIRDVLIDGTQPVFESKYRQTNMALLKAQGINVFIAMSPRFLVEPIAMCAIATLTVSMAYDSAQMQLMFPLLGALALGANRLLPALQQCFVSLAAVRGTQVSLIKVNQAMTQPISPEQLKPVRQKLKLIRELSFDDVWFSYSIDPTDWVLKNVNISIKANTTVAFIGATGCGKSTMADLVLGLLQPQRGRIMVDGKALTGQQLGAWRASIAHVPQLIYLSDATIAENIAFGVPCKQIDFERVRQAAKLAQIAEFIEQRPLTYHEIVGERGMRLSGGQRQRIGIARALYKQASVIVFDEATSALDITTEKEVMTAIDNLSHKITIIIITHRLSTIQNADAIYIFKNGQIRQTNNP